MSHLIYSLKYIPDISLIKYQSLEDCDIGGIINRHNAFMRQWNRICILSNVGVHLIIQYRSTRGAMHRIKYYLIITFDDENLRLALKKLVASSPLVDYFSFQEEDSSCLNTIIDSNLQCESVLKKIEREKSSDVPGEPVSLKFYTVLGWESSEDARLIDMLRVMNTLQEDAVYCVSLRGVEALQEVSQALEKPITYLRKKTSSDFSQSIKLGSIDKKYYRDIVAEETLEYYEDFITKVSESPCFYTNIHVFSETKTTGELLLAAALGESIKEGNAEIISIDVVKEAHHIFDRHVFYSKCMPESLRFWPTLFTLEEVSPFFRFPILTEGETIDFIKETSAINDQNGLPVGIDSQGNPVSIDINMLKKHAFICGVPGAGKTNTMLGLCYHLWDKYRVPFLALEPAKKEYRALAKTDIDKLIVFSPSSGSKFPLAINPFEFPLDISLSEHIQNLMEVFEGAFPLVPPLPALLDRSIESVYVDKGWDTEDINDGTLPYPTMTELYETLEAELEKTDYDGEVRGNMKSALEMRIGSLLRRDLGNVFDVSVSTIKPDNWIKYPIIIEMESLGKGPKNFLTLMLCTLIREVLRINPDGESTKPLRHVIFIEEAHNLIAPQSQEVNGEDANPKVAATNYIVSMLAEVRALREGIVIADQLPTAMAPEVLKNTTLKITHRVTAEDDRKLVGSTMAATDVQLESLSTFIPGETLMYYEGLLKPFKVQMDVFKEKDPPTNAELLSLMSARPLHQTAILHTVQNHLGKLRRQWQKEKDVISTLYKKLEKDCQRLKEETPSESLNGLVSEIVKDQVALDISLSQLKRIVKKYQNRVYSFPALPEAYRKFVDAANKDILSTTSIIATILSGVEF